MVDPVRRSRLPGGRPGRARARGGGPRAACRVCAHCERVGGAARPGDPDRRRAGHQPALADRCDARSARPARRRARAGSRHRSRLSDRPACTAGAGGVERGANPGTRDGGRDEPRRAGCRQRERRGRRRERGVAGRRALRRHRRGRRPSARTASAGGPVGGGRQASAAHRPSGHEHVTLFRRTTGAELVRVRSLVPARFVPLYGRYGFGEAAPE
jgi:hypothetical protein